MNIAALMKDNARKSLVRAKAFIDEGTEDSARHACLELRFAIEYIVYQHFQAYLDEVPDDAMRKWTPRQVIEQMLEVDPHADRTSIISIGEQKEAGFRPEVMKVLGENVRFSMKWANSNHNALGSFLHASTLYQVSSEQVPSAEKMLKKAREISEVVEKAVTTHVTNFNFGVFYDIACQCGRMIKRRKGSFTKEAGIKCPGCGAIYDITDESPGSGPGTITYEMRRAEYDCNSCKTVRGIGAHLFQVGQIIRCDCGSHVRVCLGVIPVEEHPADGPAATSSEPPATDRNPDPA